MKLTMAELIERSKPGYIHTITQEQLDQESPDDHHWLFPGVTGPGQYTWDEANHTYIPVSQEPTRPRQIAHDFDRGFGIGGINRYQPTAAEEMAQIDAQMRHMEREARRPRRGMGGQLWEPCPICGREPVCVNCGVCANHCDC